MGSGVAPVKLSKTAAGENRVMPLRIGITIVHLFIRQRFWKSQNLNCLVSLKEHKYRDFCTASDSFKVIRLIHLPSTWPPFSRPPIGHFDIHLSAERDGEVVSGLSRRLALLAL